MSAGMVPYEKRNVQLLITNLGVGESQIYRPVLGVQELTSFDCSNRLGFRF